jgi:hypothetical protein
VHIFWNIYACTSVGDIKSKLAPKLDTEDFIEDFCNGRGDRTYLNFTLLQLWVGGRINKGWHGRI